MKRNPTEDQELIIDEVGNLTCISCKYCENGCKRMDYKSVMPYRPFFACEATVNQKHMICSDFEFDGTYPYAEEHWCGFEKYLDAYKAIVFPRNWDDATISFFLDGDTDTAYAVLVEDFVRGNLWVDGCFNYQFSWKYKRGHGIAYTQNPIKNQLKFCPL